LLYLTYFIRNTSIGPNPTINWHNKTREFHCSHSQLLKLLIAGSPKHIIHSSSGLNALMRVIVACLQDSQPAVCSLGLQILHELVFSRKVSKKVV